MVLHNNVPLSFSFPGALSVVTAHLGRTSFFFVYLLLNISWIDVGRIKLTLSQMVLHPHLILWELVSHQIASVLNLMLVYDV